jgi:TonB-linked SusC/RagA family outer membrane protein
MRKILLVLTLVIAGVWSLSAQRSITGKVTDQSKEPLIGATVLVEGTSTGTITDVDGMFSIQVPAGSNTLLISYTGYAALKLSLTAASNYEVTLSSDAVLLSDVVVVAFGTAAREKFTGSATTISSEQIANRPISNVAQAIVGASPGVQTNAGSGQPGAAPDIRIRGFGSINASNDPLYVVDGVPFSASIANLNPDDIESITILKDAASTSLYGARAANGVVMITTKKGKAGKNQVNVKLARGFSDRAIPEYDRVDAFAYYPLLWEGYRNSLAFRAANPLTLDSASTLATRDIKGLLAYNPFNVPDNQIVSRDGAINPNAQLIYNADDLNWEKPITRQGIRDEMVVSFNGGQGKSDYFMSFSYLNDKAFLIRSDLERYTARLNFNNQVLSWLKTGINVAGTFVRSNFNGGADAAGTAFVNPFNFSRNVGPIYPVYAYDPANQGQYLLDDNGRRIYDYGNLSALGLPNRPGGGYGGRHIVAETELNQEYFRRNVWNGRTYGEITFLKDFKFTTNLSVDVTHRTDVDYDNALIGDGAPGGRAQKEYTNVTSYNLNQLLNYSKNFGKHSVSALLGHENYDYRDENLYGFRSQQILDGNTELVNFTTTTNLTSSANFYRVEGYFSRLNYDYDGKYYVSLSYRADGSSKFQQDVRWGNFWSGSAAWRLDQEKFVQQQDWISQLKLRGSYGETGNDGGISFYAWQPRYTLGFNNATEAGIIQSSLGNRQLGWEANRSFDAALEFGFFKNRVVGTVEFFHRISDNLIFDVPLPVSAGILTQTRNVGSMYNQGWELDMNFTPVRTKDFSWSVGFNLTTLKNEITKLPDGQTEIISGTKKLTVGSSIYDYWLREWYGVDPTDGAALYRANTYIEANTRVTSSGDTVSISQNNARFHYNGSAIPDFYGAINTELRYKGFNVRAILTYQKGGMVYDSPYATLMSSGNYGQALHRDMLNRWQRPGDVTSVPRMDVSQTAIFGAQSDRWLTDASFLNIRNITISYDLPRNVVNRLKMQRVGFYLAGENLKLFSRRAGMNVEQSFTGVTSNAFTPARTFTSGINVTL